VFTPVRKRHNVADVNILIDQRALPSRYPGAHFLWLKAVVKWLQACRNGGMILAEGERENKARSPFP